MKTTRKKTPYKWLRDLTSDVDFGVRYVKTDGTKGLCHANKNNEVLEFFSFGLRYTFARAYANGIVLRRMSNAKYDGHFGGTSTYYYTGNGRANAPETLVMIDVDCHRYGNLKGAREFMEWLKAKLGWDSLYYETSTNGNGAHGYLLVQKFGFGARVTNDGLKRLQQHLRELLAEWKASRPKGAPTVQDVEIKGLCPEFTWGDWRQLSNYKSGTLAKLPREVGRFSEWKKTTRLELFSDLLRLPPVQKLKDAPPADNETKRLRIAGTSCGSTSGKVISEEEIGQLSGHYADVAHQLLDNHEIEAAGRLKVTCEDLAICLMIERKITETMNLDGTQPHLRLKKFWKSLYEAGDVTRQYNDSRAHAIRQFLSSLDLLDVQDETYELGYWVDGKFKKGRAMKWSFNEIMMELLNWQKLDVLKVEEKEGEESVLEREGEKKASLPITRTIESLKRIPEMKPRMVIRPYLAPIHLRKIHEVERRITTLDEQLRTAA